MVQAIKYFATGVWVDKHLGQWITTIMIMGHVGLATAVFTGGLARFSIPSYNPLVDFTFGHVWIWGLWIFASGLLMSTPFRWGNILGLWLGMMWHWVWMASFIIAAIHYENAAATPIPAYAVLAMICTALLTARVIDKSEG